MARRYGAEHSPGGDPDPERTASKARRKTTRRKRVNPAGARVNMLFILPFLWAFSAFFRDPAGLAQHLGVFALLILSAWLTREGVIAQDAYDTRRIARRPAIPRKMFGAIVMGLGLGLAGFEGAGWVNPIIFAVLGGGLHIASFGLDPMSDKGMEGVDEFQTERVAKAVDDAEEVLAAMSDAIKRAKDRQSEARLSDFQTHVRDLLKAVQDDPSRLTAARRYMGVYLRGARDATVKFADLFGDSRDKGARDDFFALLDDLEENYLLRIDSLKDTERQSLDIEIDVLRERLEREGLRPNDLPRP